MSGRTLASVGVVLLAVTAGCAGLLADPDGSTPAPTRTPYDVPERTGTTDERVGTPAASAGFREAVAGHPGGLRSAGQFVVRTNTSTDVGDGEPDPTFSATQSVAVDLDAQRYWFGVPPNPVDGTYDDGIAYQNETSVHYEEVDPDSAVDHRPVTRRRKPKPRRWTHDWIRSAPTIAIQFPFERDGDAAFDGERMARYTASGPAPWGCTAEGRSPGSMRTVTAFSATALVDERGIIRKFECVLEGQLRDGRKYTERVSWTVTEVGTATVEPPSGSPNASDDRFRRIAPPVRGP